MRLTRGAAQILLNLQFKKDVVLCKRKRLFIVLHFIIKWEIICLSP